MFQSKIRKCTAVCLCAALLLGTVGMIPAQASDTKETASYTKTENVYARLGADGTAEGTYIVNHFQVDKSGEIADYGDYSGVTNLSTTDALTLENGAVRFSADRGDFYYQGNMENAELPWKFQITYQLDGVTMKPEELGGKDGALKISFHGEKNPKAKAGFYDHYVMQVSLTLDNETCANIEAPGTTMADAGDGTQLSFTVLPGTDADFTIETDVQNFSMSGFSIAAVPYSISIDTDEFDTDSITDQFSELTEATEQLSDGAKELFDGISELSGSGTSLVEGSKEIQDGLRTLSGTSQTILNASSQICSGLSTISSQLSSTDFSGLSQLNALPGGLTQLADALDGIQSGLGQLQEGLGAAYDAMDGAMQNAAGAAPTQEELAALQTVCQNDPAALSGYQKLMDSYTQLQTLSAVWSNVKPAFQAVCDSLDVQGAQSVTAGLTSVSGGLRTMASPMLESLGALDISASMVQLTSGLSTLAANYGQFHAGLTNYLGGVDTLAGNYPTFHDGIQEYVDGTGELANGAGEYAEGMWEYADGISGIPEQVQDTIDEMMAQYNSDDFDAVSFTDSRSDSIGSVQFVISTDGVELPEAASVETTEKKQGVGIG